MLLLAAAVLLPVANAGPPSAGAHGAEPGRAGADALITALKAHLTHEGPDGCLTPLVAELRERADELTPEERAWATSVLMPWKADLNDPVIPIHATPPPPAAFASEPCFTMGENRITSDHFAVEWDDGVISQSVADNFIDALEEGYRVQVEELGWREPEQNDSYLVLAYVTAGNYASAYTTVDYCGRGFSPYIVAYAGSFSNRSWGETMAVHELNHALQFSYGFAWEFWWWEATATYIESQVFPTSDWWAYYVDGYVRNPQLAMNASDQEDQDIFWHMYGMAIWANYIDEYVGGPDAVKETWDVARNAGGTYTFGMDDAFLEMGLDFDAAYTDFVVQNAVMAYEAQDVLPAIHEEAEIDELPDSDEVSGNDRPQGYGQSYIRFEKGAGGDGDLVVDFSGDDDGQWSVQLVEVSRTEVLRVVVGDIVDGVGTLTMPDFGENDVMLVASPMRDNDNKFGFEWSADLVAPPEEETPDGDTPRLEQGEGAESPAACGCSSTTGGSTVGIGALLGLAALARRRSR